MPSIEIRRRRPSPLAETGTNLIDGAVSDEETGTPLMKVATIDEELSMEALVLSTPATITTAS